MQTTVAKRDDETQVPFLEHPLFPLEEGGKPFEVSYISITRKEGGAMVWVPQMFRAEELTSKDQILERFGGGTYEIYARSQSRTSQGQAGHITKRVLFSLPGKPKPLDPSNATVQEEIAAGIRKNPLDGPAVPTGLAGGEGLIVAVLQMSQQQAQAQAAQSQQFMMLMMQMMSEGKKEAAESSRQMMQMFTQMTTAQQTSMMQMLPLLIGNRGGGPEEFAKYAQLMQSLGFGRQEPKGEDESPANESVGAIIENLADIMQGAPQTIAALKSVLPSNGASPPGLETGPVPPPGSAASALAGRE
jgi:hypothetical protein